MGISAPCTFCLPMIVSMYSWRVAECIWHINTGVMSSYIFLGLAKYKATERLAKNKCVGCKDVIEIGTYYARVPQSKNRHRYTQNFHQECLHEFIDYQWAKPPKPHLGKKQLDLSSEDRARRRLLGQYLTRDVRSLKKTDRGTKRAAKYIERIYRRFRELKEYPGGFPYKLKATGLTWKKLPEDLEDKLRRDMEPNEREEMILQWTTAILSP